MKIGVSSKLQRGKTTFVGFLKTKLEEIFHNEFRITAFAYNLKHLCSILKGCDISIFMTTQGKNTILSGGHLPVLDDVIKCLSECCPKSLEIGKIRTIGVAASLCDECVNGKWKSINAGSLLQEVGTYVRECLHENYWKLAVLEADCNGIIDDCRFKNEARGFLGKNRYLIRLEGPRRGETTRDENHISETDLDDLRQLEAETQVRWDDIIHNTGTLQDLELTADSVAQHIYDKFHMIEPV